VTRGRRALLLAGLALLLGTLAASDVGGRERDLKRSLEPLVDVVVARGEIKAGAAIGRGQLTVRRVPSRFAPAVAIDDPTAVVGTRAGVTIAAGSDVTPAQLRAEGEGPDLRPGERVVDIVAAGSARLIVPGTRVDVLVTKERGGTTLALEDAEVLSSRSVTAEDGSPTKVAAGLRVTVRQAVYLTAAQSFAREIRLLPRGAGDDRHGSAGLSTSSDLSGQ
jgi:pilus assembly protein CpaB